jgi:hypothetical protein
MLQLQTEMTIPTNLAKQGCYWKKNLNAECPMVRNWMKLMLDINIPLKTLFGTLCRE